MTYKKFTSYDNALKERAQDFKNLVIYYTITRPQYQQWYQDNDGNFDNSKYLSDIKNCKHSSSASLRINHTLGIPYKVVDTVLGYCRIDGRKIRIKITDVLTKLGDSVKVINDGKQFQIDSNTHKVVRDESGKATTKYSWTKKYFLSDKIFYTLLNNKRFSKVENYGSDRLVSIISSIVHGEYAKRKESQQASDNTVSSISDSTVSSVKTITVVDNQKIVDIFNRCRKALCRTTTFDKNQETYKVVMRYTFRLPKEDIINDMTKIIDRRNKVVVPNGEFDSTIDTELLKDIISITKNEQVKKVVMELMA